MSLRIQLLGLGLLTLVLPWAGYRYVQELEGALRSGLEQSLLASADTMAAALSDQRFDGSAPGIDVGTEQRLYAHPLSAPPLLDGFRDDWSSADATNIALGESRYWVGLHDNTVYLFVEVVDSNLIYQSTPDETPYGDRVLLLTEGDGPRWLLLHTAAPGGLRAQRTVPARFAPSGNYEPRVSGFWRETQNGYAVEARIPLDIAGRRLGLSIVNVEPRSGSYNVTVDSSWEGDEEPGILLFQPADLGAVASQFEQPGRRLRIVDRDGWVLFDGGEIDPLSSVFEESSLSLTERFFRFILQREEPPYGGMEEPPGMLADATLRSALSGEAVTAWYARGTEASAVVVAAVPISRGTTLGAVVLEQGSDSILTLTNTALVRLMSFTLGATLLVATGLLGYATLLSFRVRRLARAADSALSPKGEIRAGLPGRGASDEIGDLARSFADLLKRLSEYTDYLTTLKGKLAHELRTPLAVVATSLENLEREPHDAEQAEYLSRMREGASRLDGILNAMTEATVIEQAITSTEHERFDLDPVIAGCVGAYRDVYPERRFSYACRAPSAEILGSAELIVQMMDKLVDNAVGFSREGSVIEISLDSSDDDVTIGVANKGPRLPETMRSQLFDSLVSLRDQGADRRHLGLGLYVVSLITEFHSGTARADDLPDGSGVIFEIRIPLAGRS